MSTNSMGIVGIGEKLVCVQGSKWNCFAHACQRIEPLVAPGSTFHSFGLPPSAERWVIMLDITMKALATTDMATLLCSMRGFEPCPRCLT